MLAWKVPSWSQYLRMRSSISGNFTEADTPEVLEAAAVEPAPAGAAEALG
jgi:hypothetical protein